MPRVRLPMRSFCEGGCRGSIERSNPGSWGWYAPQGNVPGRNPQFEEALDMRRRSRRSDRRSLETRLAALDARIFGSPATPRFDRSPRSGGSRMVRIFGFTGSRRRRRYQLAAIFSVTALLAGFAALPAQAVHDEGVFQLDGNAQTLVDWPSGPAANDDWDRVCFQQAKENGLSDADAMPDKDNLRHAFAARYSTTEDLLYFGSDRFDNSGDAQQGFWFLQNPLAADGASSGGGFKFTDGSGGVPAHVPGDLLIISDFSIGGTVSTINIYSWVASGGDTTTHLDFVDGGTGVKCDPSLVGDNFCGIVNPGTTPSPWPFLDKSNSTSFLQGEFYEAGINLTGLGFGGECFATVVAETRSSTSPTATLKDFVVGQFGKCESGLETTAQGPTGDGTIGDGLVSSGTDEATLNITGAATWTGTLDFYLCGPFAAP